ncbi:hypothetical protein ACQ4PT_028082 [Festuca glaucescens]
MARRINARKERGVFLKIDLSRAFDSLSWAFLYEVLRQCGFGAMFLRWISLLLSTATVKILVNGVPGKAIKIVRGLRQGDLTSPQMFVIAMEVLTLLVVKADQMGLLAKLRGCTLKQRISIYADDVCLFVKPIVQDLVTARRIFDLFSEASGLQGLALRVPWEWLRRSDPDRPWQGLPRLHDPAATEAFNSLVAIKVGDGASTLFWTDRWIRGRAVCDIAPVVLLAVRTQCRNRRSVQEALLNHRWIDDITGNLCSQGLVQCLLLLVTVCMVIRDTTIPDSFCWPWSSSGQYTAESTYKALCHGSERWEGAKCVWSSWAPMKSGGQALAKEKVQEEASSSQSSNIESCNVVLDYGYTTSSESDDMFMTQEHEVFHAEGSAKELQLQEVNMNLRSGKVLPEPPKVKPPRADKTAASSEAPQGENAPNLPDKEKSMSKDVDYNIVAHLKRILALLIVYDALMLMLDLRQALVHALQVPELYEVAVAKHRLFSNPLFVNEITFDDEDRLLE